MVNSGKSGKLTHAINTSIFYHRKFFLSIGGSAGDIPKHIIFIEETNNLADYSSVYVL